MIITIDTSKDSSEDIRKAAEFLKMLAEGKGSSSLQGEFKASDDSAAAFGNLFGSDGSGGKVAEPETKKKDDDGDEIPEIIVY